MKRITAIIFVVATSVTQAIAADLCYGTLGTACTPANINVQRAEVITLPADIEIMTGESVTFRLTLPEGVTFATPATVSGGTLLANGSSVVVATCSSSCVLAIGKIAGTELGDTVVAHARLFSPNGATQTFFDGPLPLARIVGAYNATAWALNPASNPEQRTFLRIISTSEPASVILFATDDAGTRSGPLVLNVPAGTSVQLNAADLEQGNPAKGFPVGAGDGVGKWRVDLTSDQRFRAFALAVSLAQLPIE